MQEADEFYNRSSFCQSINMVCVWIFRKYQMYIKMICVTIWLWCIFKTFLPAGTIFCLVDSRLFSYGGHSVWGRRVQFTWVAGSVKFNWDDARHHEITYLGITKCAPVYQMTCRIRPLSLSFPSTSFNNNKVELGNCGLVYTYTSRWFFCDLLPNYWIVILISLFSYYEAITFTVPMMIYLI